MKKMESISHHILCPLLLLVGIGLVAYWASLAETQNAMQNLLDIPQTRNYLAWGAVLILTGIFILLRRRHRGGAPKIISYPGTRGDIVIELEWVEATLNRVIGKLKEVKWISVTVDPGEDRGKASVYAEVKLVKGVGESARETAIRVGDRLADTAANLLGVDDITRVDMVVKGGSPIPANGHGAKQDQENKPEPEPAQEEESEDAGKTPSLPVEPEESADEPSREETPSAGRTY